MIRFVRGSTAEEVASGSVDIHVDKAVIDPREKRRSLFYTWVFGIRRGVQRDVLADSTESEAKRPRHIVRPRLGSRGIL